MAVFRWHATAALYSDISMSTSSRTHYWGPSRVAGVHITEEAPCIGLTRRSSECSLRLTNDLATNSEGWRGPSMSAVATEDPAEMVGQFLRILIYETTPQVTTYRTFLVDSVEATDDGATVHGIGVDSLLDKTFDEIGGAPTVSPAVGVMDWLATAYSAVGIPTVQHPTSTDSFWGTYTFDGSEKVGDAVRGIALGLGMVAGLANSGYEGAIAPPIVGPLTNWNGALSWPEPVQTERYGAVVVKDPWSGTSRKLVLDSSQDGVLEVSAPFSSRVSDWSDLRTWAGYRHASQWYAVDHPGNPFSLNMNDYRGRYSALPYHVASPAYPVASWESGGVTYRRRMLVLRVETTFDGGLTQRLYGPLYDTLEVRG